VKVGVLALTHELPTGYAQHDLLKIRQIRRTHSLTGGSVHYPEININVDTLTMCEVYASGKVVFRIKHTASSETDVVDSEFSTRLTREPCGDSPQVSVKPHRTEVIVTVLRRNRRARAVLALVLTNEHEWL
jgi:hypothetical protein